MSELKDRKDVRVISRIDREFRRTGWMACTDRNGNEPLAWRSLFAIDCCDRWSQNGVIEGSKTYR